MNVHLVDGTFELFRAHFAKTPSRVSPAGMDVKATRGLMRSMTGLAQERGVTHIAIAFDHVIESFRNAMFDGYKSGEGIDPDLHAQFPLVERATRALGLVTWPMVEFEADDALAAGAVKYGADPRVERIYLCSPDKDLAQCIVGDRIVGLDRMRRRLLDEAGVHEKFGIAPISIPDYLGLVGDTADGIPGIPRWGAKGAAAVLARYTKIEQIPDDESTWEINVRGAKTLAANLRAQRQDAMLYRDLAVLRTDVPLAESLDDLAWKGPDMPALKALCAELGETDLLTRL